MHETDNFSTLNFFNKKKKIIAKVEKHCVKALSHYPNSEHCLMLPQSRKHCK